MRACDGVCMCVHVRVFVRVCVDAGAPAGARTWVCASEGARVPVCVNKCVGAHASALEWARSRRPLRAGVRPGVRACVRI